MEACIASFLFCPKHVRLAFSYKSLHDVATNTSVRQSHSLLSIKSLFFFLQKVQISSFTKKMQPLSSSKASTIQNFSQYHPYDVLGVTNMIVLVCINGIPDSPRYLDMSNTYWYFNVCTTKKNRLDLFLKKFFPFLSFWYFSDKELEKHILLYSILNLD